MQVARPLFRLWRGRGCDSKRIRFEIDFTLMHRLGSLERMAVKRQRGFAGVIQEEIERRIAAQDTWTFKECLALAAEFNLKTRHVVALVMARGKNYVDGNLGQLPK